MRIIMAAVLGATALTSLSVAPAQAQRPREANREYREDVRDARKEYREDLRDADSRRDVREARREYRDNVRDAQRDRNDRVRDWRQSRRYDYNRLEPGQRRYYADRYYRDGSNYRQRALTRNDRVYRGGDGRYYCRRNDGTTGLIVGGLAGGALGNVIAGGGSRLLGTLIGAGGGALLGRQVDRGQVVCR